MQQFCWPLGADPVRFAAILPLAAWGLFGLWRRGTVPERKAGLLCLLWVAGYWLAGVAFFVTARFRLPAVPLLILPAAWGAIDVVDAVRRRRHRALLGFAASTLLCGLLCWPFWFGLPQDGWAVDYVNLGNSFGEAGDLQGAAAAYRRALEYGSKNPDAHYLLGRSTVGRDPRAALEQFQAAEAILPGSPDLLLNLAQTYLLLHEPVKARQTLNELLHESTQSNLWPRRQAWASAQTCWPTWTRPPRKLTGRQRGASTRKPRPRQRCCGAESFPACWRPSEPRPASGRGTGTRRPTTE